MLYTQTLFTRQWPGRALVTLFAVEVTAHNSPKPCYKTKGNRFDDIMRFLNFNLGGVDLVFEYGGE